MFSAKSVEQVEISTGWADNSKQVSDIGERKTTILNSAVEDDFPMIPDIQDFNGGDVSTGEVAVPPQFVVAPIRTIGELEMDIDISNSSLNQVDNN
jgi:hypothetical protein